MEESYVLQMKNRKFKDLYLCFCGYAKCRPLHSFGPAVRPNYVLHYIIEGKGKFSLRGKEYYLQAGQGFLIVPGMQTFYQADEEVPWSYLWIGFAGERAEEYLKDLGLDKEHLVFRSGGGEKLKELVLHMLKNNTYSTSNEYLQEGLLYTFFSVLSERMEIADYAEVNRGNLYVRKAVEYIQNNFSNPLSVTDIAAYVGINRSYLCTLFRQELQMAPREYLTNYRITRAAELLMITELSIEGVAFSCGYQDALVFSKNFRAKMGCAPSVYRKRNLSAGKERLKSRIQDLKSL